MALGKFGKWLKNAGKKIANGLKTAGKWAYDKVIKPVGQTALKAAAPIGAAIGSVVPGIGTATGGAIGTAINAAGKAIGLI